jgi:putative addiction module killer protein
MIEVRLTRQCDAWLRNLRDDRAAAWINGRIARLRLGAFGDVRPIGEGLSELRIDYGPGYRVYLTRRGDRLVILLCGGDKKTQTSDIKRAKAMAAELKE